MDDLFKGYEIARLISYNAIKEGTCLQQYYKKQICDYESIYMVHDRGIYTLKPYTTEEDMELKLDEEIGTSILSDIHIEFKILKTCEQCGFPILDDKTREEFHGCCSSDCEMTKINKSTKDLKEQTIEEMVTEWKKSDPYVSIAHNKSKILLVTWSEEAFDRWKNRQK